MAYNSSSSFLGRSILIGIFQGPRELGKMSKPGLDRRRLAAPEPTVQPILIKSSPQPILDAELTREDGRYPEQMRPAGISASSSFHHRCHILLSVVIKRGIISRANGSAYVELGSTKLTCAVYGPRTSTGRVTMAKSYNPKGTLNCEIEFLPFSSFNRRPYQRVNIEKIKYCFIIVLIGC